MDSETGPGGRGGDFPGSGPGVSGGTAARGSVGGLCGVQSFSGWAYGAFSRCTELRGPGARVQDFLRGRSPARRVRSRCRCRCRCRCRSRARFREQLPRCRGQLVRTLPAVSRRRPDTDAERTWKRPVAGDGGCTSDRAFRTVTRDRLLANSIADFRTSICRA
ncbi:hypothetical protein SMALB_4746 [Streptomyces malaysiensis]|uniref:Uncharacterized protein n=1 Tax=Streptomyces malaysiensis TaxID=92644 RepID=A0A7X5X796_STRMQ|nr:hypothetical protein [Streptomyces malaysiensis]